MNTQQPKVIRALEVFDHVPSGRQGVVNGEDRFFPHLRHGELVVVDVVDWAVHFGEIYLFRVDKPSAPNGYVRRFAQVVPCGFASGISCVWLAFGNRVPGSFLMIDGPYTTARSATHCLGRVVGVMEVEFSAS